MTQSTAYYRVKHVRIHEVLREEVDSSSWTRQLRSSEHGTTVHAHEEIPSVSVEIAMTKAFVK
jgi:hypothetical protein